MTWEVTWSSSHFFTSANTIPILNYSRRQTHFFPEFCNRRAYKKTYSGGGGIYTKTGLGIARYQKSEPLKSMRRRDSMACRETQTSRKLTTKTYMWWWIVTFGLGARCIASENQNNNNKNIKADQIVRARINRMLLFLNVCRRKMRAVCQFILRAKLFILNHFSKMPHIWKRNKSDRIRAGH